MTFASSTVAAYPLALFMSCLRSVSVPPCASKVHRKYASMRSRGGEQALGVVMVVSNVECLCVHEASRVTENISHTWPKEQQY